MDVIFKAEEARSEPVRSHSRVHMRLQCAFSYPAYGAKERQSPCRKRGIRNHTVILLPAFTRSLRSPQNPFASFACATYVEHLDVLHAALSRVEARRG